MDGVPKPGAGGGKQAVPPVPAGSNAIARAARVPRRAAFPEDAAADAPAEAAAGAGGGGEEDDDVQVERFYALLDNIRAMRGAYGAGDGDGDGTGADGVEAGSGWARKRLRAADPPWRPAFRMEDFEEPSPTSSSHAAARHAKRTNRQVADAEEGGARLAAASASASPPPPPPPRRAGVRLDSGRKSI
ncbi:hypothetical protein SEVIR_3G275500v4 [Setaria viridis]|uniref:Uncharacterized protein n=1 Tax=Setaria viridis TaxID=4556 RepID=A0A4U6VGY7_SETVI|nr:hypothetical protein SEVIR_3G275500v2 [Setaria viridis]